DNLSKDPYNDERDSRSNIGKGIDQLSHRGTENTGNAKRDEEGHPDDSIPEEATCDDLEMQYLMTLIVNLRVMI
ncbi:hypothetical protein Tco_0863281, partial [Tanacetum coccineum]